MSMDKEDWVRVVDYSAFLCRAWQKLYFSPKVVKCALFLAVFENFKNGPKCLLLLLRYIRVVGTQNTVNRVFHLVALEAYFTTHTFNADRELGLLSES